MKRSFSIFEVQSPQLYGELSKKFNIPKLEEILGNMIKFFDSPPVKWKEIEGFAKGGETSKLFELVINNGGKAEDLAYELNNDRMVGEPDFEWEHYGDEVYTSCQDDDFDLLNRYAVGIAKSEGFDVKVSKFEKGGEVEKKENNEMIIGGLAGILLGIFLNK